jgi:hypothetical protein
MLLIFFLLTSSYAVEVSDVGFCSGTGTCKVYFGQGQGAFADELRGLEGRPTSPDSAASVYFSIRCQKGFLGGVSFVSLKGLRSCKLARSTIYMQTSRGGWNVAYFPAALMTSFRAFGWLLRPFEPKTRSELCNGQKR